MNKNKNIPKMLMRAMALVLAFAFFLEQLAMAAPMTGAPWINRFKKQGMDLNLPASVAIVDEVYKARPKSPSHPSKTIYLIQDTHTNESAQMNSARTLDAILSKEKVRYVFLEAGQGDLSLSFLSFCFLVVGYVCVACMSVRAWCVSE